MVLCGLVLLLPCAGAQDGVPSLPPSLGAQAANTASERPRATLDQVVDGFSVEEVSLPDVLHYLFNRDHVIVGIELLAPVPEGETRSAPSHVMPFATFGPAPVRDILDELVALDPEFVWREDAGVANLVRRADLEDPAYVFNQMVEEFEVEDIPYDLAVTKILGITYHDLGALPWGRFVRHRSEEGPRVTLRLRGATVRQIINEIAWQTGLAWEVRLMRHRDGHQTMLFSTAARFGPPSAGWPGCPRGSIEPVTSAPRTQTEAAEGAPAPSSIQGDMGCCLAPLGIGSHQSTRRCGGL